MFYLSFDVKALAVILGVVATNDSLVSVTVELPVWPSDELSWFELATQFITSTVTNKWKITVNFPEYIIAVCKCLCRLLLFF